jgi:hypothetical protein
VSRADRHWPRPRPRAVLAWSIVVASTLVLASLFQAVAVRALGGPTATTSVVAAGDNDPEGAPSCASLFGSYNWWLFDSDRQGPCGLRPDGTTAIPVQLSPATAALADGDDVRARSMTGAPNP